MYMNYNGWGFPMTPIKKKSVTMIDPPSGWKYGFPKVLPDNVEDVMSWLVENGYPQHEIDRCGKHFYCGYWEEESGDD